MHKGVVPLLTFSTPSRESSSTSLNSEKWLKFFNWDFWLVCLCNQQIASYYKIDQWWRGNSTKLFLADWGGGQTLHPQISATCFYFSGFYFKQATYCTYYQEAGTLHPKKGWGIKFIHTTCEHPVELNAGRFRTVKRTLFFMQRIIELWNLLPQEAVLATNFVV